MSRQIIVRDGKGENDRVTMFPDILLESLRLHLNQVKAQHELDLAMSYGTIYLPSALERKYPNANREFAWQYVFPAHNLSIDPVSGLKQRHHLNESGLQKAVKQAARLARIDKPVSPPTSSKTAMIPSTRGLGRCLHRPGTPRALGCQDHHDLHPRS